MDGVYPNPFNSQAVASYELRVASRIYLGLFDLSGHLLQTLGEGRQAAGSHSVMINGAHLSSGVYLLKLTDGKKESLSKICLVR